MLLIIFVYPRLVDGKLLHIISSSNSRSPHFIAVIPMSVVGTSSFWAGEIVLRHLKECVTG